MIGLIIVENERAVYIVDKFDLSQENLEKIKEIANEIMVAVKNTFEKMFEWLKKVFDKLNKIFELRINLKKLSTTNLKVIRPKKVFYCRMKLKHCRNNC